jgi:hypothetical protein
MIPSYRVLLTSVEELRNAHDSWLQAKKAWQQALVEINSEKRIWELAQAKFYQERK